MRTAGRALLIGAAMAAIIGSMGGATGCGTWRRVQGPEAPVSSADPAVLVQWLRDHVGAGPSIKAVVHIALRSPKGSLDFDGLLFSERPSALRLQGMSPLGSRLFDLVARGEVVTLYIDAEQRAVQGTIDELGDDLKLPALPQLLELMATMTIVPPDASQQVVMETPGVLVFSVGTGEERQVTRRIRLDHRGLPREEEWYDGQGQRETQVRYDQYAVFDGRWQPKRIEAELQGDVRVTVVVKELHENPVWRPDDFHIHGMPHAIARD
jgi:outer membrane biogenesis lipoprotein LolB